MEAKSILYGYCRCSTNDTKEDVEYQITFIGCYNDKMMFKFNDESFALNLKYLKNMKMVHDMLPYYHANICDKFNYKY